MKTLAQKQSELHKISTAERGLRTAKEKKASVLEAHKACENVLSAAKDALEQITFLEEKTKDMEIMLKELKRLNTTTTQYKTPPTIKLYGETNKNLSFW